MIKLGDTVYHVVREDYDIKEHVLENDTLLESAEWHLSVEGSPIHDNRAGAEAELKAFVETEIAKNEKRKRAIERHLEFLNLKLRTL